MQIPQTTDQFYTVLKAFKQKDSKRYPLTWTPYPLIWQFGSGGRGGAEATDFSHDGDQVKYAPREPGYKDGLTFINKLYADGLLDPEWTQVLSGGGHPDFFKERWLNGISGVQFGYAGSHLSPYATGLKTAIPTAKLVPMLPPAGPNGVRENLSYHNAIDAGTAGSIAASSKQQMQVAQFIDYIFSPQGSLLFNWGTEGDTFTFDAQGTPQFTDKVNKNTVNLSASEYIWNYISPNWFGPMVLLKLQYYQGLTPVAQDGLNLWVTLPTKRKLPELMFSKDESATIRTTMTDINTLLDEKLVNFVSGHEPLDNLAGLASQIDGMGIKDVLSTYQQAFSRAQKLSA
jgi:putative aldouronate transport system substrate-binding protein